MDYKPRDLAAESRRPAAKQQAKLPLKLLLPSFALLVFAVLAAPVSDVLITNTKDSVESTGFSILTISMESLYRQVSNVLQTYNTTVLRWGAQHGTRRAMTVDYFNLSNEINGPWVTDTFKALKVSPHITTLACTGREPDGAIRQRPDWPNATKIGFDKIASAYFTYDWMQALQLRKHGETLQPYGDPLPYLYEMGDNGFVGALSPHAPPTTRGKWNTVFFPIGNNEFFLYWWYETYFYPDPANPTRAGYSCQAGSLVDVTITPYLEQNLPSDNAVTALFDSEDGTLLSSSVVGSVKGIGGWAPQSSNGRILPYNLRNSPNQTISQLGQFILEKFDNYSVITEKITWSATLEDGKEWFVGVQPLIPDDFSTWMLIVAYPRSDFFTQIDRSITDSAIVLATISSIGGLFMIVVAYFITHPLVKLDGPNPAVLKGMGALECENLNNQSIVLEVALVEKAFADMVKA
ncbi:hypothetical protein BDK51DRAFT_31046, partial [Blyttiomyces helicus]